jgi:hypothetical protein
MSENRKNWTAGALKKASEAGFWNGTRMFLDHAERVGSLPTRKKGRSMKDLVSGVESTTIGEDGRVIGTVQFFDENFYAFAKRAKDYMGTSVDLLFKGELVKPQGEQPYYAVEELIVNNSVDWVVNPAAGGKIDEFLAAHEGEDNVEWSEVTAEMIRQHRPDLVGALESKDSNTTSTPPVGVTADQLAVLVTSKLQEAREEWDQEHRTLAAVGRLVSERISAAKLPSKITNRLVASFDGTATYDADAIDAAIKQAREELEDAGVKPKIRGAGATSSGPESFKTLRETAPTHAALERAFGLSAPAGSKSTEGGND